MRVDPGADYQRAGDLIQQHTGVEAGRPADPDDVTAATIEELLAGDLTIDNAVRIALLNHRDFLSLFYEIGVSRAEVVQSGLLTNPSLSLLFRLPEGGGIADTELSIVQQISDLWQIPVKKKVARAQLEQTVLRVVDRAIGLAAEVKTRYYELVAARLARETARSNVGFVEQFVRAAESQMRQGEGSRLTVNLQRVGLLDVNIELLAAERNVRVAEVELARSLGLSRSLPELRVTRLPPVTALPEDVELLELGMRQRVDAQIIAAQVHEADEQLKLEIISIIPTISLGFDIEQMERRALPSRKILADTARSSIANGGLTAPSIQSRGERNIERSQIIDAVLGPSLTVTLPIWDQNQAQIAKAAYRVEQRRQQFENLLDDVALGIRRSAAQARNALEMWQYYRSEALPAAEEMVREARQVYEQGEENVLALVQAQRSLATRRAAFVQVERSYAVALTELEAAVGGRLPAFPATQPAVSSRPTEP